PEQPLEPCNQGLQVARKQRAERRSEQGSSETDHHALNGKCCKDVGGPCPQSPQYRNVRLLFLHDHDQCGDDVEGGDRDDHQQDDEHHRLGQLDGTEEIDVIACPIADVVPASQSSGDLHYYGGGLQRVLQRQPDPGHAIAQVVQLRRIGHVHQRKSPVKFIHT